MDSPAYMWLTLVSCLLACLGLVATVNLRWRRGRLALGVLLVATVAVALSVTAGLQLGDWLILGPGVVSAFALLFGWEGWLALRAGREPWFAALSVRRMLRRRAATGLDLSMAEIRDRYASRVLAAAALRPELSAYVDEIAVEVDRVLHERLEADRGYVPSWALRDAAGLHVRKLDARGDSDEVTIDEFMLAALCRVAARRGML